MRLATRMKITYGMVFLVPILLIILSFWGIGRIELRRCGKNTTWRKPASKCCLIPLKYSETSPPALSTSW